MMELMWTFVSVVPLKLVLNILIWGIGGLAVGIAATAILQKYRLLVRRNRWLGIFVKLYWIFIPVITVSCALQIALTLTAYQAFDQVLTRNSDTIRAYTTQILGDIQNQLNESIEAAPTLKDLSLNKTIDSAVDAALIKFNAPVVDPAGIASEDPGTGNVKKNVDSKVLGWLKEKAQSAAARTAVKQALYEATRKTTGTDKKTVEQAFETTLQEFADSDIVTRFTRERAWRYAKDFAFAALLQFFLLLLIPAAEITLSKWRGW